MYLPILNQTILLLCFTIFGFLLSKFKVLPLETDEVLSKLENFIFVPAIILSCFLDNCTIETLKSMWKTLVFSATILVVLFPISFLLAKWICNEKFLRKIAWYSLLFSNFGFMGNAIVKAVCPEIFFDYTIFILPFWFVIYLWAVPALLLTNDETQRGVRKTLKALFNPMFIALFVGLAIGLMGLRLPTVIVSVVDAAANCMAPVAMILTGVVIAKSNVWGLLKKWQLYVLAAIRVLIFPIMFILICWCLPIGGFISETMLICGMFMMCMPLGLNPVIVPAAYGADTSEAAGMTLISGIASIGTIPLMFWIFQTLVL